MWGELCALEVCSENYTQTVVAGDKMQSVSRFSYKRRSSLALLCEHWNKLETLLIEFFKSNTGRISLVSFAFCFYCLYLRIGTNLFMKRTTASLVQIKVKLPVVILCRLLYKSVIRLGHMTIKSLVCRLSKVLLCVLAFELSLYTKFWSWVSQMSGNGNNI